MRDISAQEITKTVSQLCPEACYYFPGDVLNALQQAREVEESPIEREVIDKVLENADIAAKERIPLCQDTGAAVVFLELGQDVHIVGGDLYEEGKIKYRIK